ncbi:MAG: ATP-grasp domain-containing protein [Pseudomonadota bacterium]
MPKSNVLVLGASGTGAIDAIRFCRKSDLVGLVHATDFDPKSVGFLFCDRYLVRSGTEVSEINAYCESNDISLIIPASHSESERVAKHESTFSNPATLTLIPKYEVVKLCNDKLSLYRFLSESVTCPMTSQRLNDFDKSIKIISKPRSGRGSEGIVTAIADNFIAIDDWENYILQEFIVGSEFTVDVVCDAESNVRSSYTRRRLIVENGVSICSKVERIPLIDSIVEKITKLIGLTGIGCLQFIRNNLGELFLIEINPRLAGGFAASQELGGSFIENALQVGLGLQVQFVEANEGTVCRYLETINATNLKVT